MSNPIVVGGTGGSGTRLVTELLIHAGVFMGEELNYALDSLLMARLNDRYLSGRHASYSEAPYYFRSEHWGWKHTKTYLLLPVLYAYFRDMTFIHVIRDGRDLAYAPNIALQVFWNSEGIAPVNPGPETIMALWATTNMACANFGESFMSFASVRNYHQVRYEDLCHHPEPFIQTLYGALGLDGDAKGAVDLVRPSSGMGRWRGKPKIEEVTRIGEVALRRFGYL
jgi:hypothetical protein